MNSRHRPFASLASRVLPLLLACASCAAVAQPDPPGRAGSLSQLEGSVVLAPAGETEWSDAALNRPITSGDRLWTDLGGRAEVHLGSAVLHLDDESFLETVALDRNRFKASLHEGTLDARVRELAQGDAFEIDTPQLAFRAAQAGDYRVDVDPNRGTTQISVRSGAAIVYGADGRGLQLLAGQQLAFTGRLLDQAPMVAGAGQDAFDRWVAERNWREDQSIAANFIPRDVVGYSQLDVGGAWVQDPNHGAVWYPDLSVPDWAPYRYGRWEFIKPWGWSWIDDARWGFAPFHYGRWAMIGSRWAWVPGRLGPRPVYAPALVAFVGASRDGTPSRASGPGIAWYPLAPGEAWQPLFHASTGYLRQANRAMAGRASAHAHQRRPEAVTAVRIDDFTRGQPVQRHWQRANPGDLARAPSVAPPGRVQPQLRREEGIASRAQPVPAAPMPIPPAQPPMQAAPSPSQAVQPRWPGPLARGERPWPQARVGGTHGEAEDPYVQQQRDRMQRDQQREPQWLQRQQPLDQWQRLR